MQLAVATLAQTDMVVLREGMGRDRFRVDLEIATDRIWRQVGYGALKRVIKNEHKALLVWATRKNRALIILVENWDFGYRFARFQMPTRHFDGDDKNAAFT